MTGTGIQRRTIILGLAIGAAAWSGISLADDLAKDRAFEKAAAVFGLKAKSLQNLFLLPRKSEMLAEVFANHNFHQKIFDFYSSNEHEQPVDWNRYISSKAAANQSSEQALLRERLSEGGGEAVFQALRQTHPELLGWTQGMNVSFGLAAVFEYGDDDLPMATAVAAQPRYGLVLKGIDAQRNADGSYRISPQYTIGKLPPAAGFRKIDPQPKPAETWLPEMRFKANLRPETIAGKPGGRLELSQVQGYYTMSMPATVGSGLQQPQHAIRGPLGDCRTVERRYSATWQEQESRMNNIVGSCSGPQIHVGFQHEYEEWYGEYHLLQHQVDYRLRLTGDEPNPKRIELWLSQWL